jgi:hypothetical protein
VPTPPVGTGTVFEFPTSPEDYMNNNKAFLRYCKLIDYPVDS